MSCPETRPGELLIIPHTHWDREWYRPFESYRYRLVEAIEGVLVGDLPHFLLDGQTAMVDDFLAICPERRDEIAAGIGSGRFSFGPWYVLVDEFLVSGEALIRNLLMGREAERELGVNHEALGVGYLPDMFGHIAQMPQILAGFGLQHAVVWRGAHPAAPRFAWVGPDGTRTEAAWLPQGYYQTPLVESLSDEQRLARLTTYVDAFQGHQRAWLLSGADHMGPRPDTHATVQRLAAASPSFRLRIASLSEIFEGTTAVAELHGELRTPVGIAYMLPGVLSSRVYLKQRNAHGQRLLERLVEPLAAHAWWSGRAAERPFRFVRHAWRTLMLNHPHDSICGCSVDQVHREMLPRFDAVEQMAEELLAELGHQVRRPVAAPQVCLFNPSGWAREEWTEVTVDWPRSDEKPAPDHLILRDQTGHAVPFHLLDQCDTTGFAAELDILPDWYPLRRYRLAVLASLPAWGGQCLQVEPASSPTEFVVNGGEVAEVGLENAHFRLTVEHGDVVLLDKRANRRYARLHRLEDHGEAGDSYNHSPPREDLHVSLLLTGQRLVTSMTPGDDRLEVCYAADVPLALAPDRSGRGEAVAPLEIHATFRLRPDRVEVESRLAHHHQDHRLRLFVTVPEADAEVFSEGAFGIFPRPDVAPSPLPVAAGHEAVMPEFPVGLFSAAVGSSGQGLAIATEGLHEVSVRRTEEDCSLAVTLLRAVGWLSRDDLQTRGGGAGPRFETPEAQCPGEQIFRYALIPLRQGTVDALAPAHHFANPIHTWLGHQGLSLSPFVRFADPRIVLSALKRSEDGQHLVVRAYNPFDQRVESAASWREDCGPVREARLDETPLTADQPAAPTHVSFGPYAIKTWLVARPADV
ncbi:MAG: glycosyl hydrolase-related protein [Candidatus Sericytochromatia bacterium]|nr:glycosyl hydrolase-related protein [Candidatus Sericytochromatia bacterium]